MAIQEDSGNGDVHGAMATNAIAAVSDAAIERGARIERDRRRKAITILVGSVALLTAVLGAYQWISSTQELPVLADMPVAILLPKIDSQDIGEHDFDKQEEPRECACEDECPPSEGIQLVANDNACRQKEGFDAAFHRRNIDRDSRYYYYFEYANLIDPDTASEEADYALQAIKTLYERGVRVFIVTMSGALKWIKPKFEKWATENDEVDPRDRPILIATVASAPDIANQAGGVLRHYIRSKDEVDVLSIYMESIEPAPEAVGIFRVNDDYGKRARELLHDRLRRGLGSDKFKFFKFSPDPEKKDVEDDVGTFIRDLSGKMKVAVIVGYGKMMSSTLEALRTTEIDDDGVARRFEGPILVVSTFTEKQWRPESLDRDHSLYDREFAKRIHAVGPASNDAEPDEKGVVYQFSNMTLGRALTCTDDLKSADRDRAGSFWDCWTSEDTTSKLKEKWAVVEFTADGDSHVTLRLLDYDENDDDWN